MQLVGLSALQYDEQYYSEHKQANLDYLGHGYWQEEYAKMVSKGLPLGTVFDGGCACGSILNGFKKLGHTVVGVDLNEHMIELGKAQFGLTNEELQCKSMSETNLPDESIDLYHSAQVLEHIDDKYIDAIFAEMHRIMKSGAKAFLCLDAIRAGETKDMYMGDPTHINIQPTQYWAKKITETGFLFDIESYNSFVRSEHRPTKEVDTNFFESYPYWSVFTLIKE